tara:strand:+ start:271 stop:468 length:198 start_codon:yes stop_codon:yes gene_type:complete
MLIATTKAYTWLEKTDKELTELIERESAKELQDSDLITGHLEILEEIQDLLQSVVNVDDDEGGVL